MPFTSEWTERGHQLMSEEQAAQVIAHFLLVRTELPVSRAALHTPLVLARLMAVDLLMNSPAEPQW